MFITIFLILLLAVFATFAYFTEPSEFDRKLRDRINELNRDSMDRDAEGEQEIVREQVIFSRNARLDRFLRDYGAALRLQALLDQAKLRWSVGRFFFYSACLLVLGAIIGNWWLPIGVVGWIPGVLLGLAPLLWALYRRSARFRRFNLQLPDAVDLISRSIRAGHSLPSALVTVAEEMADPLGPEFRRTADELNYGLPFREALGNLERRFPLEDLQFLVSAILLQRETGGNLAELLDKTGAVLRARIQLKQKVRVYTAQGKLTGAILIALPFFLFLVLSLLNPGYTRLLLENELGRKLIYGALVGMALGIFVIRRIVQIKY
jgi:tight adherence protein B